jgi:hypothetical protein
LVQRQALASRPSSDFVADIWRQSKRDVNLRRLFELIKESLFFLEFCLLLVTQFFLFLLCFQLRDAVLQVLTVDPVFSLALFVQFRASPCLPTPNCFAFSPFWYISKRNRKMGTFWAYVIDATKFSRLSFFNQLSPHERRHLIFGVAHDSIYETLRRMAEGDGPPRILVEEAVPKDLRPALRKKREIIAAVAEAQGWPDPKLLDCNCYECHKQKADTYELRVHPLCETCMRKRGTAAGEGISIEISQDPQRAEEKSRSELKKRDARDISEPRVSLRIAERLEGLQNLKDSRDRRLLTDLLINAPLSYFFINEDWPAEPELLGELMEARKAARIRDLVNQSRWLCGDGHGHRSLLGLFLEAEPGRFLAIKRHPRYPKHSHADHPEKRRLFLARNIAAVIAGYEASTANRRLSIEKCYNCNKPAIVALLGQPWNKPAIVALPWCGDC